MKRKTPRKKVPAATAASARRGAKGAKPADWRAEVLGRIRALIKEADPEAVEETKWRKPSNPAGVPVWSHAGIVCAGETYKDKVKLTFACGAALSDPSRLFNAGLDGGTRRAIDFHEGDEIDEVALKALIRAAVALNVSSRASARGSRPPAAPKGGRRTAGRAAGPAKSAKRRG